MRIPVPVALAAAVVLAAPPLAAQSTDIGVAAGVSSSTFAGDPSGMTHHKAVTAGVAVRHRLAGRLALESGLHWLQSGGSGTVVVPGGDESLIAAHQLSYLTLPLLLRVTVLEFGGLHLGAVAGPSVAYRVSCSSHVDPGLAYLSLVPCGPRLEDGRLDLVLVAPVDERRLDVGLLVGGGVTMDQGAWALTFDARYGFGMRNLRGSDGLDVRNETLTVTAGLAVPVGD